MSATTTKHKIDFDILDDLNVLSWFIKHKSRQTIILHLAIVPFLYLVIFYLHFIDCEITDVLNAIKKIVEHFLRSQLQWSRSASTGK